MPTMGITVVPFTSVSGEPRARVIITGTDADDRVTVDEEGAELAIGYDNGQFQVLDFRGADAVSG